MICQPSCLSRLSKDCGVSIVDQLLQPWAADMAELITWHKWEHTIVAVNDNEVKQLTKLRHQSTRPLVLAELLTQLRSFGYHISTYTSQSKAYKDLLSQTSAEDAVIVIDFAESYTCQRQGEAQSAYYSRTQVTVHLMVMVINYPGCQVIDSVVVVRT